MEEKRIDATVAQITPDQVTPGLRSLFRTDGPLAPRCFAVLEGSGHAGRILTDSPADPTWVLVREGYEGVTYLGGQLDSLTLASALTELRQGGDVLVVLAPDDPRLDLLPPDPDLEGWTLDFYDRPAGEGLDDYLHQAPEGCEIRRLDRDLILRTEWGPGDVEFAGGLDAWERGWLGYCLLCADEVVCEATAGPPAIGLREPGVFTHEAHRGKGYATLTVAHLVHEVEALGQRTYWNCSKQNVASAAVARKMGYRIEKEYRWLLWGEKDG